MENDKTEILGAEKTEYIGNEKTEYIANEKTELIDTDKTEYIGGDKTVVMPVVDSSVDEDTEQNSPTAAQITEVLPKSAVKPAPASQNKTVELKYKEHFLDSSKAVYTSYSKTKSGMGAGNIILIALIVLVLLGGALGGFMVMNHSVEQIEAPAIGVLDLNAKENTV